MHPLLSAKMMSADKRIMEFLQSTAEKEISIDVLIGTFDGHLSPSDVRAGLLELSATGKIDSKLLIESNKVQIKMSSHPLQKKLAQAAQNSLREAADIEARDKEAMALWKTVAHLSGSDKKLLFKLLEADIASNGYADNHDDCG